MSSNLKVNTILPSTGANVAIGTAGGTVTIVGNVDIDINSGISTFNDIHISDKIAHDGDTNTAIRFPAADTITFETNGGERFRITDAASSFTNKLIIDDGSNGHLFLNNTSSENTIHSGTTGFLAYKNLVINAAQHIFKVSNTEKLRIDSSGRVLINTTTTYPSNQILYVKGGSPSTVYDGQAYLEGSETSGAINTGGTLVFGGHDGGNARTWGAIRTLKEDGTSGNYGSYMAFLTRPNGSAPTEKLRIKSDGNIGMGGNTNPTNVLHIKTAVTNTAVVTIESTATNSYPFLRLKNDAREYQLTCHGGNSDAFVIYDGTSSANRLIIDSNGGVDVVGGYIGRNLSDSFTLNGVNQPHYGFQLNASSSVPVAMSGYYGIAFATEGTERARIERAGHLVPGSNNSYDLGSSSKRWRNVYTTDLQLSNKGKTNDVDNTWGDYTIQEGESDLFLINNRNGKKYKFNLTEVS